MLAFRSTCGWESIIERVHKTVRTAPGCSSKDLVKDSLHLPLHRTGIIAAARARGATIKSRLLIGGKAAETVRYIIQDLRLWARFN